MDCQVRIGGHVMKKVMQKQSVSSKKLADLLRRRRDSLRAMLNRELVELRSAHGEVRDSIDEAVDDEHRDIQSQLASAETRELEEVENALQRLALGTFGKCAACDEAIPAARLQALPYATRCVKCQRSAETHRGSAPLARFDWPTSDDSSADNDLSMDNLPTELGQYA